MSGGRWSFVSGQQCLLERSEGKYKKILLDRRECNNSVTQRKSPKTKGLRGVVLS